MFSIVPVSRELFGQRGQGFNNAALAGCLLVTENKFYSLKRKHIIQSCLVSRQLLEDIMNIYVVTEYITFYKQYFILEN